MMAVWSLFGAHDVKLMNPAKVLLVAAANTMAVICFVTRGTIAWHPTVTMLIAASLGGYLGARLTLMLNSSQLRAAISVLNFVVTIVFFVTYGKSLPNGDIFSRFKGRARHCEKVLVTVLL
jgi:uncharacterized membrane protein YfcA